MRDDGNQTFLRTFQEYLVGSTEEFDKGFEVKGDERQEGVPKTGC